MFLSMLNVLNNFILPVLYVWIISYYNYTDWCSKNYWKFVLKTNWTCIPENVCPIFMFTLLIGYYFKVTSILHLKYANVSNVSLFDISPILFGHEHTWIWNFDGWQILTWREISHISLSQSCCEIKMTTRQWNKVIWRGC